jgi:hypothetical protein
MNKANNAVVPEENEIMCHLPVTTDNATCDASGSNAVVPEEEEIMYDLSVTIHNATCDASESNEDAVVRKNASNQTHTMTVFDDQLQELSRLMYAFQEHLDTVTNRLECLTVVYSKYEHALGEKQKHLQEIQTACKRRFNQRNYRRSTEAFPVSLLFLRPFYTALNKIL